MPNKPTIYGRRNQWSLAFDDKPPVHFSEFTCATCRITYTIQDERQDRSCPLCRMSSKLNDLEALLATNEELVQRQSSLIASLSSQVNGLNALNESIQETSPEEVEEIAAMVAALFRVKTDGPARLSPVYRKGTEAPVGFMLSQFGKETIEFRCSTVGGVSLAMRYAEMLRSYGSDVAEKALARAIGSVMDNSKNIDEEPKMKAPLPWEQ